MALTKIHTQMTGSRINTLDALKDRDRLQISHVVASATQKGGGGMGRRYIHSSGRVIILTKQCLWHAASPESHTLPSALGSKQMFGNRGRPQSPAHGGKEALTEREAAPLCRPHRMSHLGRGGEGTQPTSLSRKLGQPVWTVSLSQPCVKTLQRLCAGGLSFSHYFMSAIQAWLEDTVQFGHYLIKKKNSGVVVSMVL